MKKQKERKDSHDRLVLVNRTTHDGQPVLNVFTTPRGDIVFAWPEHYIDGTIGWRELEDGKREVVKYDGHYDGWRNKDDFNSCRYGSRSESQKFEDLGNHKFRGDEFGYLTDKEYIVQLELELRKNVNQRKG